MVLFLTVAVVLALAEAGDQLPASGSFNCTNHNRSASQNNGTGCLAYFRSNPSLYERCRDSSNLTCYIFLQEPPFIIFEKKYFNASDDAFILQKPFKCDQFEQGKVGGIAFELHNLTSSRDDWCMWGGHAEHCTFNQLVDFTDIWADEGYRFAITGLLLDLPQRQCRHHPSAPVVDSEMIIIGKTDPNFRSSRGPFDQLIRPFETGAWALFIGLVLFAFAMSLVMALRFHWSAKRSLVSACFIFAGNWEEIMDDEDGSQAGSIDSDIRVNIAKKYALASLLFRIALVALVAIFALFYEVAVVDVLFQAQSQSLSKPVTELTREQLKEFAVLDNSALEDVWTEIAAGLTFFCTFLFSSCSPLVRDGKEDWPEGIPWKQCRTATECIEDVKNKSSDAEFMVTFEIVGKYLSQNSSFGELAVHETRDVLYQFNGGWLYNMAVNEERRLKIDRELNNDDLDPLPDIRNPTTNWVDYGHGILEDIAQILTTQIKLPKKLQ
ncbi:hypothetical protein FGB62_37g210 [Gracilaria domingensis]|nr:hypothetical protein FGB62_37g210 [Gracilaria domingensis]